ncbi:TetR/AcrR family transcriptional regulator [Leifsonia kafniensis]|uniref:TetR/AcrR family transcriptional regulator n=1 Tax=Leifsonia kafniensis TaxID=475957 RepID=A0ABP7L530_9MICO
MAELTDSAVRPTTHAKVRILATADTLFYSEGVHTVGVDRIISESRVTKATFYKYFRSKDGLIVAYIEGRDKRARAALQDVERRHDTPERRLHDVASMIATEVRTDSFHGCPFINAAAQFADPMHPVRQAVSIHREWYVSTIEDLFRGMGHPRPGDAADDFFLARDGAFSGANLGDPIAAQTALLRAVHRMIEDSAG